MFSLNENNKFMVYCGHVDLRKGVEPLSGLVRMLHLSPTDGSVYVLEQLAFLKSWEENVLSECFTLA